VRHQPILTADQRRELSGVALLGAGAVLAVLLLIPGGGTIAGPVHDGFFTVLGVGAWLVAAGFGVTGARLLQGREWRGGLLAGIGSLVTVLAILGFLGLAAPGSAGWIGNRLGPGIADRLGAPASAVLMLVGAALGLVLAIDLRIAPVASWIREHLAAGAEESALTKRDRRSKVGSKADVNLTGGRARRRGQRLRGHRRARVRERRAAP
jgi:4TM region of DNA translocase FtsK/SpoIIIE